MPCPQVKVGGDDDRREHGGGPEVVVEAEEPVDEVDVAVNVNALDENLEKD